MNLLEKTIAYVSPRLALQRAQSRHVLSYYEGAQPSRQRAWRNANTSPNNLVLQSAAALRNHARYLEINHDIVRGMLRTMVNNTVGAQGIGVEPQPRNAAGKIDTGYADELRHAWREWCAKPEVTHRLRWPLAQRLMAYTWLRDGEAFAQQVIGPTAGNPHGSPVPYSLELLEPDFIPLDFEDIDRGIRQGVQCNAWGRPVAYHAYKHDPREGYGGARLDLKVIPAERMLHLATIDRLHQLRGVSELASVITRLEDLKDFEESERIAAKVAASLTAYVKRNEAYQSGNAGSGYQPGAQPVSGGAAPREELHLEPGVILDSLQVGEEIGLIDTKRPNTSLVAWRAGQLRAVAAGVGASYSSVARDYDGTYSAQRQELVEQWVHYAVLTDEFTGMLVQPVWEQFVAIADVSRQVRRPRGMSAANANDALFVAQAMPWIDPLKEATAWKLLTDAGFASEVEVMRKRGVNPTDMLAQIKDWREKVRESGVMFGGGTGVAQPASEAAALDDEAAQDDAPARAGNALDAGD